MNSDELDTAMGPHIMKTGEMHVAMGPCVMNAELQAAMGLHITKADDYACCHGALCNEDLCVAYCHGASHNEGFIMTWCCAVFVLWQQQ